MLEPGYTLTIILAALGGGVIGAILALFNGEDKCSSPASHSTTPKP